LNNRTRKPNRLQNYDYSRAGYYFITICTQNRQELFGEIIDSRMITNAAGEMLTETWCELPKFYHGIRIDQFQIMPNHVHGIIVIVGDGPRAVPTLSLSDVVQRFKSLTTRLYIQGVKKEDWEPFDAKLWQRSFFEHVIRDDKSLNKIRVYIRDNPLNWELDKDNLANLEGFLA
jgi:REP element-mobilizing transposase RayT